MILLWGKFKGRNQFWMSNLCLTENPNYAISFKTVEEMETWVEENNIKVKEVITSNEL